MWCPACDWRGPSDGACCPACGAADLEATDQLAKGRYRLRRQLREDSAKRAFLARDLVRERDVVASLFRPHSGRDVRVLRSLQGLGEHPRVVSVLDGGGEEDQLFLVSEQAPGLSLRELLNEIPGQRLPSARALGIFDQLLEALAYVHARGFLHRDVNPDNIWIDTARDDALRLGGFGFARGMGDRGDSGPVRAAAYSAPEQLLGHPEDGRTDLYAAGAVLYVMLTGRPPFAGASVGEVIARQVSHSIEPDVGIAPALNELLASLLAKRPDLRPTSARAVRERLVRVRKEAAAGSTANRLRAPGAVWVGRREELERAENSVEEALAGGTRWVMLAGEPGIGKTRTAERLMDRARSRGAGSLVGRCAEGGGAPPYWPWLNILRGISRSSGDVFQALPVSIVSVLAELLPELRAEYPDLPALADVDPEQARFRLFDAVAQALQVAADDRGLALLLDDVQWADEASLLLLEFLLREVSDARLLFIATYRDAELEKGGPVERALASAQRTPHALTILLSGLGLEEVRQLAEEIAGRAVSTRIAEGICERTAGNPLFVGEIVRHLQENGLSDALASEDLSPLTQTGLPGGVRAVITQRLARLRDACLAHLQLAAVAGSEVDLSILAPLADLAPAAFVAELGPALRAELLSEDERRPGRLLFSHALIRETIYESLPADVRSEHHRRIAERIESFESDVLEAHLDALAIHRAESCTHADEAERAIDTALAAAQHAAQCLAFERSADHYRRALVILETHAPNEHRRCELLLALADSRARVAVYDSEATQAFEQVAASPSAQRDPALFARAALGLAGAGGRVHEVGRYDPNRVRLLDEALTRLPPTEFALRARVAAQLATELCFSRNRQRVEPLSDEALSCAERARDSALLAFVLDRRHWAFWGPENAEERLRTAQQIIALAEQSNDRDLLMRGHHFQFIDALEIGDIDCVDRELENHEQLAAELGLPLYQWWSKLARACKFILTGRFDEAAELAADAVQTGKRAEHDNALLSFNAQLGVIGREKDRMAETPVREMAERFPEMTAWRCALAVACVESGNEAAAQEELDRLVARRFEDVPRDAVWLTSMSFAAEASAALGDVAAATLLYDRLLPYADRCAVFGYGVACTGSASRFLGMLATTIGRFEDAERHLRSALEINLSMNARPWLAHVECEYARLRLKRDAPGDREAAAEQIARALRTAESLGMGNLLRKLVTLRLHAQGAGSRPGSPDADSARASVLPLLAAPGRMVTLVFSDVVGFTEMTNRLGDESSYRIMREHNAMVRGSLAEHDGYEVELLGDGFLLAFERPTSAIECMRALRRRLCGGDETSQPLQVRVGIHMGEAIQDFDRFFGRSVILASRLSACAAPGEILISDAVREHLPTEGVDLVGASRVVHLKGFADTQKVWEVRA